MYIERFLEHFFQSFDPKLKRCYASFEPKDVQELMDHARKHYEGADEHSVVCKMLEDDKLALVEFIIRWYKDVIIEYYSLPQQIRSNVTVYDFAADFFVDMILTFRQTLKNGEQIAICPDYIKMRAKASRTTVERQNHFKIGGKDVFQPDEEGDTDSYSEDKNASSQAVSQESNGLEAIVIQHEMQQQIHHIIQELLNEDERFVVSRRLEGMSYPKIFDVAQRNKISLKNPKHVERLFKRSVERIKNRLTEWDD